MGERGSSRARRTRALRLAAIGNVLPVAVATATDLASHRGLFFLGAADCCVAAVVATLLAWRGKSSLYLAAFAALPGVTLMQAYNGGAGSQYSLLMAMAMVWLGLQATERQLAASALLLAACCYLPMLLFGAPAYPARWAQATLLLVTGATVAVSLRVLTRHTEQLTRRLREEAVVDELTGLLNRRGWGRSAQGALARAGRTGARVAVVLIDLDRLKYVNDAMGHAEGDRLIRETAARLRTAFRAGDVVARLGGDEFAAMLTDATLEDALLALERLRECTPATAGFSAGVAAWSSHEGLEELMRRADLALYGAKAPGAAKVGVASPRTARRSPARAGGHGQAPLLAGAAVS